MVRGKRTKRKCRECKRLFKTRQLETTLDCVTCRRKEYKYQWAQRNIENRRIKYTEHKEKINANRREQRRKNREKYRATQSKWRKANIEKVRAQKRAYYHRNKERIKEQIIRNRIKNKDKLIVKHKLRMATDPNYRTRIKLRREFNHIVNGTAQCYRMLRLLGCSIVELRKYLENKFLPGMTWENWSHSGWHIDHIQPLTSFNLADDEQAKIAFNYTNLQPLWAADNIKKSNK